MKNIKEEILKEFDKVFTYGVMSGTDGDLDITDEVKDFISESIDKALSARDEEWRKKIENKRKTGRNGEGLPFENEPEKYGNARLESYKNGYNQSIDDLINSMK